MSIRAETAKLAFLLLVGSGCFDMTTTHWEQSDEACPGNAFYEPWESAQPGEVGLDGAALETLAREIEQGKHGNLHALLVIRRGRLAFERYFEGDDAIWGRPLGRVAFGSDTLHDQRSVTKSVVGALVGIANGRGLLSDLDRPLLEMLPPRPRDAEGPLYEITLRHALTMSAGLAWDELSHPYWDPRNDETGMWFRADPVGYVLSRGILSPPGTQFAYNGGLPTLLAAVVEEAAGVSIDRFAAEELFCPLGIRSFEWLRHRSGLHVAASGLRLRPRDMARFGWMMLSDGRMGDRVVVPPGYVRASLGRQIDTGLSLAEGYGYQWWIDGPPDDSLPIAIGNGGQRIALVRSKEMVVVVTAGDYDAASQGEGPARVINAVMRSVRGRAPAA
jgi:CubicO group peptidase (beta-lactamase class C family)